MLGFCGKQVLCLNFLSFVATLGHGKFCPTKVSEACMVTIIYGVYLLRVRKYDRLYHEYISLVILKCFFLYSSIFHYGPR